MAVLIAIILVVVVVALYPVVRDFIRRRRAAVPAYVEGLQLALDDRKPEAIARLKEAVRTDQNNVDAYVRLGDLYIEHNEVERGIRIHENLALRRNLGPADEKKVYQALSQDYLRTDRKLKAISALEEVTRLDRANTRAHEQLLQLYLETGSWDKCKKLLQELSRAGTDPTWTALLLAEFGRTYAQVKPDEATEYFNAALRLDPKAVAARLYLGDHQMSQGDAESAIRTWSEIIRLAPEKNWLVRSRLERAHYELGRYEEMTRVYEQLLRKVPADDRLAIALAMIYQKKGDSAAAARLLEGRPSPAALNALVLLHIRQGQTDRAAKLLDAILDQSVSQPQRCDRCGEVQREPSFGCQKCRAWLPVG